MIRINAIYIKGILLVVGFLCFGEITAQDNRQVLEFPILKTNIDVGKEIIAEDSDYLEEVSNPSAYQIERKAMVELNYLQNIIPTAPSRDWTYIVTYKLLTHGGVLLADGQQLVIKEIAGDGVLEEERIYSNHILHDITSPEVKVEIVSAVSSGTSPVPEDIVVSLSIVKDKIKSLEPLTEQDMSIAPQGSNDLLISFDPIEGAQSYELEWSFIDVRDDEFLSSFGEGNEIAAFHYNTSTRVELTELNYLLPLTFHEGKLFFRYRGKSQMINNSNESVTYSNWIYYRPGFYGINETFEGNKNWQIETSFAEEGKRRTTISYLDGTLRSRQMISNINTDNSSVITETKYDHEGRPSVSFIPIPVDEIDFKYRPFFNARNTSVAYDRSVFDEVNITSDPSLVKTSFEGSGAARYYSDQNDVNSDFKDYIPDADGYTFSQTIFTRDATGRVKRTSGVGEKFQLYGGHDTRYFYSSTNETELRRLFGSYVGNAAHYRKNMVQDPNGQLSISYIDMYGRTIASALAGEKPNNVHNIAPAPETITTDLLPNNEVDEENYISSSTYVHNNPYPNTVTLEYDLTGVINSLDAPFQVCESCWYDFEIQVYNPSGSLVFQESDLVKFSSTLNCSTTPDSYDAEFEVDGQTVPSIVHQVFLEEIGAYTIVKNLSLNKGGIEKMLESIDLESDLLPELPSLASIQQEFLDNIDYSGCDLTCDQHCERQAEAEGLTSGTAYDAFIINCKSEYCGGIIDQEIDDHAVNQCDGILFGIRNAMRPTGAWFDRVEDLKGATFLYDLYDDVLGLGALGIANLDDLRNNWDENWFGIDANGDDNFNDLEQEHPEYCHYLFCIDEDQTRGKKFFGKLHLISNMEDAAPYIDYTSYSTPRLLDPDEITWHEVEVHFPFNNDPNDGFDGNIFDLIEMDELYSDETPETSENKWILLRQLYFEWWQDENSSDCNATINASADFSDYYDDDQYLDVAVVKPKEVDVDSPQDFEDFIDGLEEDLDICDGVCEGNVWNWMRIVEKHLAENGCSVPSSSANDLFISEYIEGTSNNKCIEIFNGTGQAVNLGTGGYDLVRYSNGSTSVSNTISLTGTIANGDVFVVCNPSASSSFTAQADLLTGSINHNGDDVIALRKNGNLIDIFGAIGEDPGSEWMSGSNNTANQTLVRNADITAGNVANALGFPHLATEWTELATNDFSNLGSHTFDGGGPLGDLKVEFEAYCSSTCGTRNPFGVIPLQEMQLVLDGDADANVHLVEILNILNNACSPEVIQPIAIEISTVGEYLYNEEECNEVLQVNEYTSGFVHALDQFANFGCFPDAMAQDKFYNIDPSDNAYDGELGFRVYALDGSLLLASPVNHKTLLGNIDNDLMFFFVPQEISPLNDICQSTDCVQQLINLYNSYADEHILFKLKRVSDDSEILLNDIVSISLPPFQQDPSKIQVEVEYSGNNFFGAYFVKTDLTFVGRIYSAPLCSKGDKYSASAAFPNWFGFTNTHSHCSHHSTFIPDEEDDFPFTLEEIQTQCEQDLRDIALENANNYWQELVDQLLQEKYEEAINECFNTPFEETFTLTYDLNEYHYTLYYYDQSGNLMQTVPPEGVRPLGASSFPEDANGIPVWDESEPGHNDEAFWMKSVYKYDGYNNLVDQRIPDTYHLQDEDNAEEEYNRTRYYYNDAGLLRFSRNPKQSFTNQETNPSANLSDRDFDYSYTKYDNSGRIIEVGEITDLKGRVGLDHETFDAEWPKAGVNNNANNSSSDIDLLREITRTYYDQPYPGAPSGFEQSNLQGRVSAIEYIEEEGLSPQSYTIYSYDSHGNVDRLGHDIDGLGFKQMKYEYDLISGNVKRVIYQADQADQFIHRYSYDLDNRLTQVETSRLGYLWELDATYFYYPHGPLARVEIGEDIVQGMDYYYTLQGWLKGINDPNSDGDPGGDGLLMGFRNIPKDEFSMQLGYFDGDYAPIGNGLTQFNSSDAQWTNTSNLNPFADKISNYSGLYNGNIGMMVSNIPSLELDGYAPMNVSQYQYDQLHRLTHAVGVDDVGSGIYRSNYTYDKNGNLENLNRWKTADGSEHQMDNLTYHYNEVSATTDRKNNKLRHVTEDNAIASTYFDVDIRTQSADNYNYDEIGNLIQDDAEEIEKIEWTVYGKVKSIERDNTSDKEDLIFNYDGGGNRIEKIVIPKDEVPVGSNNYERSNESEWEHTYYALDAQGNILSTYESNLTTGNVDLSEHVIYGSGRLGVKKWNPNNTSATKDERFIGYKNYELTNHLGNVMAVVSDGVSLSTPDPGSEEVVYTEDFSADVGAWSSSTSDDYPNSADIALTNDERLQVTTRRHRHGANGRYFLEPGKTYRISLDVDLSEFTLDPPDDDDVLRFGLWKIGAIAGDGCAEYYIRESGRHTFECAIEDDPTEELVEYRVNLSIWVHNEAAYNDISGVNGPDQVFYIDNLEIVDLEPREYVANVVTANDYYPFGMQMPARNYNPGASYRYGFQNMERDDEVSGNGNSYTTMYRSFDPRLGRWKSVDPLASHFSQIGKSPYSGFWNNPIYWTDPSGLCPECEENVSDPTSGQTYESSGGSTYEYNGDSWVRQDGSLGEITVSPDNSYHSNNPSTSSNNSTGYTYDRRDLEIRNRVVNGLPNNVITRYILRQEQDGNFLPLYSGNTYDDYVNKWGSNSAFWLGAEHYMPEVLAPPNIGEGVPTVNPNKFSFKGLGLRPPSSTATKIGSGHAFDKHVIERGEFPNITSKDDLIRTVDDVMMSTHSQYKSLSRGREAWYRSSDNTLVIKDPNHVDEGTIFRPNRRKGQEYFDNLR